MTSTTRFLTDEGRLVPPRSRKSRCAKKKGLPELRSLTRTWELLQLAHLSCVPAPTSVAWGYSTFYLRSVPDATSQLGHPTLPTWRQSGYHDVRNGAGADRHPELAAWGARALLHRHT